MDVKELKESATLRPRGRGYDEFEVGQAIQHHWGRTVTQSDAIQYAHLTLSYNPLYFNVEYARALGHRDLVVCPHLVFNMILGLSVEDNSEGLGGPFLSVFDMIFHKPVYVGDTLTAQSETLAKRITKGDPNKGVVTWHTEGFNQEGDRVIDFKRSNLAVFEAARVMREGTL